MTLDGTVYTADLLPLQTRGERRIRRYDRHEQGSKLFLVWMVSLSLSLFQVLTGSDGIYVANIEVTPFDCNATSVKIIVVRAHCKCPQLPYPAGRSLARLAHSQFEHRRRRANHGQVRRVGGASYRTPRATVTFTAWHGNRAL